MFIYRIIGRYVSNNLNRSFGADRHFLLLCLFCSRKRWLSLVLHNVHVIFISLISFPYAVCFVFSSLADTHTHTYCFGLLGPDVSRTRCAMPFRFYLLYNILTVLTYTILTYVHIRLDAKKTSGTNSESWPKNRNIL